MIRRVEVQVEEFAVVEARGNDGVGVDGCLVVHGRSFRLGINLLLGGPQGNSFSKCGEMMSDQGYTAAASLGDGPPAQLNAESESRSCDGLQSWAERLAISPMKTGKEKKPSGNIHRQQLFCWLGADIDEQNKNRKVLSDALVEECLERLRGSLENGLWVKTPRKPEKFDFSGKKFSLNLPITCFTEWSLGESLAHTTEYGRIGFGFPKRWVIDRGGQSVTYFCHNQKMCFLRSMFKLLDELGEEQANGIWQAKADIAGFDELRYMLHFAKMIRLQSPPPKSKREAPVPTLPRRIRKKKISQAAAEAQKFKRKFGKPLEYVEEREWRVVYHSGNKGFVKGPGGPNKPDYYLPYLPGEELLTVVLPDNKVVSAMLQDKWFTKRLFKPGVPPVMLLSHSDLGTF